MKLSMFFALAGALALVSWAMFPRSSEAAVNPGDGPYTYVVGGGQVGFGAETVNISAHNGPNGPFGHVTEKGNGFMFQVDVTCVRVSGKTATVSGVVKKLEGSNPFVSVGVPVIYDIYDGGDPGQYAAVDGIAGRTNATATCSEAYVQPPADLTSGNITVYDATATP